METLTTPGLQPKWQSWGPRSVQSLLIVDICDTIMMRVNLPYFHMIALMMKRNILMISMIGMMMMLNMSSFYGLT